MVQHSASGEMEAQRGFTYIGMLLMIAFIGLGLTAVSEVWSTTARRQKNEQLEWVGHQFVQGIGTYYEGGPHGARVFPSKLSDLIEDYRLGSKRRHLRQIYVDPFSGSANWDVVTGSDGRIRGVRAHAVDAQDRPVVREFVYVPIAP